MSVTITWLPNIEYDIDHYDIQRAPDVDEQPGTWINLVTIPHNTSGPNYNPAINRFFYDDATGTLNDWYRLRAVDVDGNASAYGTTFKPSESTSPPTFPNTVALFENYNTENALQITDLNGNPLENVQIRVYKKIDYDLNNFDAVVGQTLSTAAGGWQTVLFVDAGLTYTIHCFKPYAFSPKTQEVTVP